MKPDDRSTPLVRLDGVGKTYRAMQGGTYVALENFDISHTGLAQGFFFDGVASSGGAAIMALTLMFDRQNRPPALINDEDIDPLAVDRMQCVVT
mgnify:CR=1 FL=1